MYKVLKAFLKKKKKKRHKELNVLKSLDIKKIGLGKRKGKKKSVMAAVPIPRKGGKRKREEKSEEKKEEALNKVVMLFDGTTNSLFEEKKEMSNVGLLFEEITDGQEVLTKDGKVKYCRKGTTLVVYYAGPCTKAYKWGLFGWTDFAVGLSSLTICDDALDGFKRISKGCASNTDVFVFGFSRGAAIARMFVQQLHREKETAFPHHNFAFHVGVFDTVSQMGEPRLDAKYFDLPSEAHVVHLRAVDEMRNAFPSQKLTFKDYEFDKPFDLDNNKVEIWLPGDHSTVGGGHGLKSVKNDKKMLKKVQQWQSYSYHVMCSLIFIEDD